MTLVRALFPVLLAAAAAAPTALAAQETERPVAFDSAARVMTITPPLAARLGLSPPVWPVTGSYVEARLLDRGNDAFVISVQRSDGTMTRFSLSLQQRAALSRVVDAAMANDRLSTGERLDVISAPAGGQFVRNQTIAGIVFYGPGMAALTGNASTGTALYLLTAGATFFTASAIARSGNISRAQNHMATDGIWRGAAIANGLRYIVREESPSGRTNALITLGGALAGSTLNFQFARHLTDGEAHSATFASSATAAFAAGVLGIAGGFQGNNQRLEASTLIGAALVGYPIGLRYVRRASYSVTAGDVSALETSALVGVLAGGTLVADSDAGGQGVAAFLTTGLVGGIVLGDQLMVRRYDLTENQGWLVRLGTIAGGLIALAIPVGMQAEDARAYLAAATAGAVVGMGVTTVMLSPSQRRRD